MADKQHRSGSVDSVSCAVITVSDTRTADTDKSGGLIVQCLEEAGHRVMSKDILPDDPQRISSRVRLLCDDPDCQAVILNGGTGLSPRDTTFEAVSTLFDKRLDGFGELFRWLSYQDIGPAAMLSRAVAGVRGSTVVFSIPGATDAVRLAMERLILPELGHVVWLARGGNRA